MDAQLVKQLAPTGELRAAIDLGNPVLASRTSLRADPRGVSVDLARALAGRLGLALSPMVVDSTAMSVDAVVRGQADIGFFALHQARAGELRFTAPYLLMPAQFNIIQQAIGMQARHSDEALARVQQFVEDMKADGFVARALKRHNIVGVHVAPLQ